MSPHIEGPTRSPVSTGSIGAHGQKQSRDHLQKTASTTWTAHRPTGRPANQRHRWPPPALLRRLHPRRHRRHRSPTCSQVTITLPSHPKKTVTPKRRRSVPLAPGLYREMRPYFFPNAIPHRCVFHFNNPNSALFFVSENAARTAANPSSNACGAPLRGNTIDSSAPSNFTVADTPSTDSTQCAQSDG